MTEKLELLPSTIEELRNLDINSLKAQELGLNLLLLSLAQRESKRISKLASVIDKLEDQIFNESLIEHLSPSEQIQRYQLAVQATQQASTYISAAIKNVNWQDIETRIMILDQQATNSLVVSDQSKADSIDLQSAALQLLRQLSTGK